MKKILVTGNKNKDLASAIFEIYPEATFASRETGFELTNRKEQERFAELILEHDVFINCAALWKFQQTVLLDTVYKVCVRENHNPHIICLSSTTDRVKKGGAWLYNAEKKALRDYSNTLGINGVWGNKPKITLLSFGTLSNNKEKHPDRKCLSMGSIANYIKWIIDQPKELNVNELSVDPMQNEVWY